MNKKIILISALVAVSIVALGQVAYADNATLSVAPATASKTVGTSFNVSVNLDPQGNKVCVVTGTLSVNGLTCKSISVASGLMAQTTPTCAAPSFILGIPKCTTVAQNLLTVSVKGSQEGTAKASVTGAKVIGAGTIVASTENSGTYNITAVPATTVKTPAVQETPQPTEQPVVQPTEQTVPQAPAPVEQTVVAGNVGTASFSSVAAGYFWPLLTIFILLCLGYGIYYMVKRKKK